MNKFKKITIPKRVRSMVWQKYVGKKWKGECYVEWCNNEFTVLSSWHVGHNIPESRGGTLKISNLRPICADCNLGMGSKYTIDEWSSMYGDDYNGNSICNKKILQCLEKSAIKTLNKMLKDKNKGK
jgi:hypothetical protein